MSVLLHAGRSIKAISCLVPGATGRLFWVRGSVLNRLRLFHACKLVLKPWICYAPVMTTDSATVYPFWLSGQQRHGPAVPVLNPYDGSIVGAVCQARTEELSEAVAAMRQCGGRLMERTPADRQAACKCVLTGLQAQRETFAQLICLESGKPIATARSEVERAIATFSLAVEESVRPASERLSVENQPAFRNYDCHVERVPVGPSLFIAPFNFPLNLVAHKVAPALACGCPFILKPSDRTPLTALRLGELLAAANLPVGSWHILPTATANIQAMATDPDIALISFTGSEKVGWELYRQATGKTVLLELGSNSPVIVEPDADLADAAERIVRGAFGYSGQSCISVQRIYLQKSIAAACTRMLVEKAQAFRPGDPLDPRTDIGPMIDLAAARRVEQSVRDAVTAGGKLLCGGQRTGNFYPPTLLTDVPENQPVVCEEIFGPVAVIQTYDTLTEAIQAANCSRLGIHAGIFTFNPISIQLAWHQFDFAGVVINDVPTTRADAMPYGGVKYSGLGREGVRYAMEHLTRPKALLTRHAT